MFDNIQAYTGNVIGESPASRTEFDGTEVAKQLQTPDEILDYAAREAADIISKAQGEAAAEREAVFENAKLEAEKQIAEKVVDAVVGLRMELFSAKAAMGEVLTNALGQIVGKVGHDKLALAAVEKAIEDYGKDQKITVFGNSKTLERLRLVAIGSKKKIKEYGFEFELDAGLSDGRCVLSNEYTRVEVGLDAQLSALKKVFHTDAVHALKQAKSSLVATGKLM